MSDFAYALESALRSDDVAYKRSVVDRLLGYCNEKWTQLSRTNYTPMRIDTPSYASICRIVQAKQTPARKRFDTPKGLASLLHAIAHIEYSAIDLALDAVYRFTDLPVAFKRDWLEVAHDEIRHFSMLEALLNELGFRYGDFAVHAGLFEAGRATAHDALERMAVIPRFYEATGLDVNPQIVKKLQKSIRYAPVRKAIEILQAIYIEELEHVAKGDRWFKYLCDRRKVDYGVYFAFLQKHNLLKARPHVNVGARKKAGFSCEEIRRLGAQTCR